MKAQTQRSCSNLSIISIASILFYCAGFLRIEMELSNHRKKITALEDFVDAMKVHEGSIQGTPAEAQIKSYRNKRNADTTRNATEDKTSSQALLKINKLLSSGRLQLCQPNGYTSPCGPPGPPGPPGPKGKRGRPGKNGDKGRAGEPGKSGKRGMTGITGLKGNTGPRGEKGDIGATGMPGMKGEPGESISGPTIEVSPQIRTVNETESTVFQCSVSGNPKPKMKWNRLLKGSELEQSTVSEGRLQLRNIRAGDAGMYQCSATNILGQAQKTVRLVVNVRPRVSLNPGPMYAIEGSNITLPICRETGHPRSDIKWLRPFGQLPQGRVQFENNNSTLTIFDVRRTDSDNYVCVASNLLGRAMKKTLLLVFSPPKFISKPPEKIKAISGFSLKLNCSVTPDGHPVISWKRQGAQLPAGRSFISKEGLVITDLRLQDAGNYTCIATIAGKFSIETSTILEIKDERCAGIIKTVGTPVLHYRRSTVQGAWMRDPLGVMGKNSIFVMESYHRRNVVEEYEDMAKLKAGVTRKTYQLPYNWHGTGAVVYGSYLYYNREGTSHIDRYNLQTERLEGTITLSDFSFTSYQWGGASRVDLAVDEHGLWVLWGSSSNKGRLNAAKIDVDSNRITRTWTLNTEPKTSMGNAFVACGVIYCIDEYNDNPTTINFAYDTKTGKQWNPNIQFINRFDYNSMVDYNPREKVLYAWDHGRFVTYSLTFQ